MRPPKKRPFVPREEKVFSKSQIQQFFNYASILIKDQNKVLSIIETCFDRWEVIPREFLKVPEVYFYQLLRKRCYLELGDNHKQTTEKESDIVEITLEGLEGLEFKDYNHFIEYFDTLENLSREVLYFWAIEKKKVDQISKIIGRKRSDILFQLLDIREKLNHQKNEADNND